MPSSSSRIDGVSSRMGDIPKPVRRNVRPNSANAKLQTHPKFYTSLFDDVRPTTATSELLTEQRRPQTHAAGIRNQITSFEDSTRCLDSRHQRRLTVAQVDGIAENGQSKTTLHRPVSAAGPVMKAKIEEKLNIETLEELKHAFQQASYGSLNLNQFKTLIREKLHVPGAKLAQIDSLFQKIDWSSEGAITWDEFCTYMQLEYAEQEDSYLRAKEVAFHLPAKTENTPHREPILRITDTSDGVFVACSKDGSVSFWSNTLDLKRNRSVVTPEMGSRQKQKWITDFMIMNQYNKFIVSTGDREIAFFELSSFEPYCQISGLETVPLRLDHCAKGNDEIILLYGDSSGCVNIFFIRNAGECLRTWKKMPRQDGIANVSIEIVANSPSCNFIRWKVHGDWVQELKYYHSIRQVMTCSNHANTALVMGCTIGSTDVGQQLKENTSGHVAKPTKYTYSYLQVRNRLDADQNVFKIYKGVKTFDFSKSKNVIITGGMDRILRIWNPYVTAKPTGTLRGHNAPINYLRICEEEDRIYSVSMDRCVRVWDIQDHNCLLTIRPKGHKIRGDLQTCFYSPIAKGLAIATDQISIISQRLKPTLHAEIPITHKSPVHCCKYNSIFKQVITCSENSVIKVWDFESGEFIFEYGDAHGDSAITCMTFDNTGRRLITGGRDGSVRIWNYNNGHCLRTMRKEINNEEICDLTYIEMNKNRFILSVGWDRRMNMYPDSLDNSIHHIQPPLPPWPDDEINGHKEDIMSVAQCAPNLLATSSYDGEVIVWNLVSGHVFCHLRVPKEIAGSDQQNGNEDFCIKKVLFLLSRQADKDCATLVSSGPQNMIHFWSVYSSGVLFARFIGTRNHGAVVTCLATDKNDTRLYSADSMGFICIWNIKDYCTTGPEENPPDLAYVFRGHIESVTSMELIEDYGMIMTSSLDCTVRLWTTEGEYVGTFGQNDSWDIYDEETFQHPMVPYDVLVDPMSLPNHPVLGTKRTMHEIVHEDSAQNSDDEKPPTPKFNRPSFYIDDATIAAQIKEKPFNKGTGKRLRHEKSKLEFGPQNGHREYQFLKCYELEDTPEPAPPRLRTPKGPFDFFDD